MGRKRKFPRNYQSQSWLSSSESDCKHGRTSEEEVYQADVENSSRSVSWSSTWEGDTGVARVQESLIFQEVDNTVNVRTTDTNTEALRVAPITPPRPSTVILSPPSSSIYPESTIYEPRTPSASLSLIHI